MARKKKTTPKFWTKDEIKTVLNLWETERTVEIAKKVNRHPNSISYIARAIRDSGYKLPKKRTTGVLQGLVRETLVDEGLMKQSDFRN